MLVFVIIKNKIRVKMMLVLIGCGGDDQKLLYLCSATVYFSRP